VELREPRLDRLLRLLSVGVALLVGMALATLYLRIAGKRGAPSCARGYVEAQTAVDTALVDEQATGAAVDRLDAARNATCGELRLRGELR
jgi:hypothetical protein